MAADAGSPTPAGPALATAAGSAPPWPARELEPRTGLAWVHLLGGRFPFGCMEQDTRCEQDEPRPALVVEVPALWMLETEVTVRAYAACAAEGACPATPHDLEGPRDTCNWRAERLEHPMNCVDQAEAAALCRWLGGRLPTAREWEYAARSGQAAIYPWGDGPVTGARANFCDARCAGALANPEAWRRNGWLDASQDDGFAGTAPVGAFDAGVTAWGLADLAGNVAEWTSSSYQGGEVEVRGGSWYHPASALRVSFRTGVAPGERLGSLGFRCARERTSAR